ncbi:MAG: hypothetical protein PHN69_08010 [Candidatus Pacebacteria bacterium]|nr:hypothetical protein [Candidatus Paceibacterota bacterium]
MENLTNEDALSRLQKIDDIAIEFIENGSYENANRIALDAMKEMIFE